MEAILIGYAGLVALLAIDDYRKMKAISRGVAGNMILSSLMLLTWLVQVM